VNTKHFSYVFLSVLLSIIILLVLTWPTLFIESDAATNLGIVFFPKSDVGVVIDFDQTRAYSSRELFAFGYAVVVIITVVRCPNHTCGGYVATTSGLLVSIFVASVKHIVETIVRTVARNGLLLAIAVHNMRSIHIPRLKTTATIFPESSDYLLTTMHW
jgi:hypothetical protein